MDRNSLDYNKVVEKVKSDIADYRLRGQILSAVVEILSQYEGKRYNKRITDVINTLLNSGEKNGYMVYFEDRYGMLHLYVRGKEIPYDHRIDLFLGYTSRNPEKRVDMNFIRTHNAGYLKFPETADKLEAKIPGLMVAVSRWNTYMLNLERLIKDIGYSNDVDLWSIRSQFTENLKTQIF